MFFICHYNGKVLHSGERAFFHPTKSNSPDLGFIIETNGKIPASAGKKEEVNCVFLSVLALKVSQNVVKREFKR
jgi:hypothetical protein